MVWGILRQDQTSQAVAAVIVMAMAVIAVPVYLPGEPAEERVEDLAGVSVTKIEEHEEAAGVARVLMTAAGVASLLALLLQYRSK